MAMSDIFSSIREACSFYSSAIFLIFFVCLFCFYIYYLHSTLKYSNYPCFFVSHIWTVSLEIYLHIPKVPFVWRKDVMGQFVCFFTILPNPRVPSLLACLGCTDWRGTALGWSKSNAPQLFPRKLQPIQRAQ